MTPPPAFLVILAGVQSLLCVAMIVQQIRELRFYRANGWDFEMDSNITIGNYYHGDSGDPAARMSNKARVLYGRPFFIFVVGLFAVILDIIVFGLFTGALVASS